MNISSHVFLPNRWKLGQHYLDGTIHSNTPYSMTHFFPIDTTGHLLFYLVKDCVSRFGKTYAYLPVNNFHQFSSNRSVFDGANPVTPSIPFTYILIK